LGACVNWYLVEAKLQRTPGSWKRANFWLSENKGTKTGFFWSGCRSWADYRRFDGENWDIRNFWYQNCIFRWPRILV